MIAERDGQAEIDKAHVPLCRYENVGRLQVSVDDKPTMGIVNGFGHCDEELSTLEDTESLLRCIRIEGLAFHKLHDEIHGAV